MATCLKGDTSHSRMEMLMPARGDGLARLCLCNVSLEEFSAICNRAQDERERGWGCRAASGEGLGRLDSMIWAAQTMTEGVWWQAKRN
jgi:hypothetical protein